MLVVESVSNKMEEEMCNWNKSMHTRITNKWKLDGLMVLVFTASVTSFQRYFESKEGG